MPKSNNSERPVIILTEFKEIFFGYTKDTTGDRIQLHNARQACYFSEKTHGLLGLASMGPQSGSRIGPSANLEVRKIVNVIECTSKAADAWEAAKWE